MLFPHPLLASSCNSALAQNDHHVTTLMENFFSKQCEAMWYWYKKSMFPTYITGSKTAIDIIEQDDAFRLVMEVPGVSSKEITLTAEQQNLYIQCTRKHLESTEEGSYLLHELPAHDFERIISFPQPVDIAQAVAFLEKGLLVIAVPKSMKQENPVEVAVQEVPEAATKINIISAA